MKARFALIGLLLLAALSSLACYGSAFGSRVRGSGSVVEEERAIAGVTAVTLATFGDLYIEVGEEDALVIEAESNLMDYIETDVIGGRLTIDTRPGVNLRATQPVRFYLTVESLEEIKSSGSGDIYAPDIETIDFSVITSGSGDITLDSVKATSTELSITGSGDVVLDDLESEWLNARLTGSGGADIGGGAVADLDVTIAGSGDMELGGVKSETARVHLTGSGSIDLWVAESLDVNITGSGDVDYRGRPAITSRITGSGDLNTVGE